MRPSGSGSISLIDSTDAACATLPDQALVILIVAKTVFPKKAFTRIRSARLTMMSCCDSEPSAKIRRMLPSILRTWPHASKRPQAARVSIGLTPTILKNKTTARIRAVKFFGPVGVELGIDILLLALDVVGLVVNFLREIIIDMIATELWIVMQNLLTL